MSRLTLSDADKQARDWFVQTTESLGCRTQVDGTYGHASWNLCTTDAIGSYGQYFCHKTWQEGWIGHVFGLSHGYSGNIY